MSDFQSVFQSLKTILQKYQAELVLIHDQPDNYYLNLHYTRKDGYQRNFGSVQIKKNYVSYQATGGLKAMVNQIARQNGVPVHIAHGVIMAESRYNCGAYNRSGASGIMQVLPNTARSVGVHGSLRNCANGLQAGMKYLKLALNRGGYGCSGVSLYERGVYARPACTAYGRKVMAYAQRA